MNRFLQGLVLFAAFLVCSPAEAQPAPASWSYSFIGGVATATYIGNVNISGSCNICGGSGGSVNSVFGRSGNVVAVSGDYSVSMITGAAPIASPTFTGVPLAPTAATADNSTQIATTAYVQSQGYITSVPVTSVFGRTGIVVAVSGDYSVGMVTGAAPLASPTFAGVPSAPTPSTADNSTKLATTAYVQAQGYITTSAVSSVFGRSGIVVAAANDYNFNQLAGSASAAQMPAFSGDASTSAGATVLTLATVNANVGSFGNTTNCPTFTVNAKGLITAASQAACTPALAAIAADNLLANSSGSSAAPVATPIGSCSGATNALIYNTGTHAFGCNTISGSGTVNAGTTPDGAYYASSIAAVSDAGTAGVTFGGINIATNLTIANGLSLCGTNTVCIWANSSDRMNISATGIASGIATGPQITTTTAPSATVASIQPNRSNASGLGGVASVPAMVVTGTGSIENWSSTGPSILVAPSDAGTNDNTLCRNTSTNAVEIGSGTLGICLGTSSIRYKTGVVDLTDGLPQILALEPRNFYFNNAQYGDVTKIQYGFIAEEAINVLPNLVGLDTTGQPNSFDYLGVVPVLVKAVQQEDAKVNALQAQIAQMQSAISTLQMQVKALTPP